MDSSPVVSDDGSIYVKDSYILTKLDESGKEVGMFDNKWNHPENKKLGLKFGDEMVLGPNGDLYVAGPQLIAFDANLKYKWHYSIYVIDTPVIASDGKIYLVGNKQTFDHTKGTYLITLDKDGKVIKEIKMEGLATSPVISPDGTIYVGGDRLFKFK